ncbi:MAG TPA: guanylate kinase [Chlamydiales bacterium]|jgi:guanylate kinase
MAQLLGGLKRGLAFVLSAPAGTGKTTLVRMLLQEFPSVTESVSFTTRSPRKGEVPGFDYHFVTPQEFEARLQDNEFLEHATVFQHSYGTSRKEVERALASGKHVILVIDTQGALQLMGSMEATFIFISPPNLSELKNRLHSRRSETPETIEQRLSWAEKEISLSPRYDYHIINEDLQVAYEALRSILIAEEHKTR